MPPVGGGHQTQTLDLLLDARTGRVLVEGPDRVPPAVLGQLEAVLGPPHVLGCARPLALLPPPSAAPHEVAGQPTVRVAGYYHDSLVEGPGRRSCALLAGCDLGCPGCWTPALHPADAGTAVPAGRLADALLDPAFPRDGVSLLGGEPFQQPEGLLALVRALRDRGCAHLLCYSGYTYERLRRMARHRPAVGAVLDEIQLLVDGPYMAALASSAGPWTGSGNQRVLDLVASRAAGRLVRWEPSDGR
jgi:anaerobic ribonucleoside-triphosphate reductase activating protein